MINIDIIVKNLNEFIDIQKRLEAIQKEERTRFGDLKNIYSFDLNSGDRNELIKHLKEKIADGYIMNSHLIKESE